MGSSWSRLMRRAGPSDDAETDALIKPASPENTGPSFQVVTGGLSDDREPGHHGPLSDVVPPPRAETIQTEDVDGSYNGEPRNGLHEKDRTTPLLSDSLVDNIATKIAQIILTAIPGPAPQVAQNDYRHGNEVEHWAVPTGIDLPDSDEEEHPPFRPTAPIGAAVAERISYIQAGAKVTGGVHDFGDSAVCIGGNFVPEKLTCGDLTVLEGAFVKGDIFSSGLVKIHGLVENSDIWAKDIEIYETAEIRGGSMKSDTLGVQVGARLATNITTDTMRNRPAED